mmetsp:Transcript_11611/g.31314  ORF Transcript_11611/g.31314 Transcript_11611/m.31314 type:complete len:245 (-) Transcript_11611:206-940(-)
MALAFATHASKRTASETISSTSEGKSALAPLKASSALVGLVTIFAFRSRLGPRWAPSPEALGGGDTSRRRTFAGCSTCSSSSSTPQMSSSKLSSLPARPGSSSSGSGVPLSTGVGVRSRSGTAPSPSSSAPSSDWSSSAGWLDSGGSTAGLMPSLFASVFLWVLRCPVVPACHPTRTSPSTCLRAAKKRSCASERFIFSSSDASSRASRVISFSMESSRARTRLRSIGFFSSLRLKRRVRYLDL